MNGVWVLRDSLHTFNFKIHFKIGNTVFKYKRSIPFVFISYH